MIQKRKTPLELLDDIYSLAYHMTGTEQASRDLVNRTYVTISNHESESEVLKTFRECYLDQYGQDTDLHICDDNASAASTPLETLKRKAADVKLSVLLSEISGLRHAQISEVLGKPVETVRTWLFWGRKFLIRDCLLKASA
ncbi:RNA polymerase subunit sigma-24 [Prosthecochloris sp. ZM_2]|uniref:RNA polymerase sigma factor n=1 Tax=Prosthecochloris sp. ZM_2 TaxID=2045206 RepID=UPI000DF7C6F6|nr:sigma factor-like helix-turn-helix DNA-binding protein [Prosthecochloris sp. ZM_2]RNA64750.1 RNA polymerase subunit sigma-24 [Prosthecochloris sp. ZM_2]